MSSVVHRCAFCGAPLTLGNSVVIDCRYCGEHNELRGAASPLQQRAEEARSMVERLRERSDALEREWRALLEAIHGGQPQLVPRFLELHEGWLRLTYAPTVHFLQGMNPADPTVQRSLGEIDAAVEKVLAQWRAMLPAAD